MKFKSQLDRWIFNIFFPNYEKLKYFVVTFIPCNQILIFEGTIIYVKYGFYIFNTEQTQINSVIYKNEIC